MMKRHAIEPNNFSTDERFSALGLEIHEGWDVSLASQLVIRSLEPTIRAMTPRDAHERFPSIQAAMKWFEDKPKTVYSLSRAAGLAGVVWFSEQQFRGAERTFAIRLYESARGRGLAKPFAKAAHFDHEITRGYTGDTWLETSKQNAPAQGLFPQLGYELVDSTEISAERLRMIRKGITTRMIDMLSR